MFIFTPVESIEMKTLSLGFGGKDHPELFVLGKYSSARFAFETYAIKESIKIIDQEKSNVFAAMCERQIGNLSYGFDHEIRGEGIVFRGFSEAFAYSDNTNYGSLRIEVHGPDSLVDAVENAWNYGKEISAFTKGEIIEPYVRGKQHCYGLCKRE